MKTSATREPTDGKGKRNKLIQELSGDFASKDLKNLLGVEILMDRLNLKINENVLFSLGGAERFPSNWQLSAVRASTVVRYLIARPLGG